MFTRCLRLAVALCLFGTLRASAAVLYVNVAGTNPVSPFSSWAAAATNIQDAVDAANTGDEVLVTNGVYQYGGHKGGSSADVTNRVAVSNAITVQSVNGPGVTIIQGFQPVGASNANNAVRCASLAAGAVLSGFTLTGGQAGIGNYENGGGVVSGFGAAAVVSNCLVISNIASGAGGGAYHCTLINCVLTGNSASDGGGAYGCTLNNCTLAGNFANGPATAPQGGGAMSSTLNNCIVYDNTGIPSSTSSNYASCTFNYSCTSPNPGGTGNITNAPGFLNLAAGDFHLQIGSPCINAGDNAYVTATTDLDGNPRIVGGTVDMGAYENQFSGTVHYVSLISTNPVPPYTNWSTAATNIQDAIGVAQAGEIVVAGDGNYNVGGTVAYGQETNRVAVTNPVMVLGFSGPQGATISGGGQMRCAYVGTNAVLSGFTLTGGLGNGSGNTNNPQSGGGGAWCEASGVVSNCVFSGNAANEYGGGDYGGTVCGSVLSNNSASYGGGAAFASLIKCTIVTNIAQGSAYGGGVYQAFVSNCLILSNWAYTGGGGAYQSTLYNSTVCSNSSPGGGGGADKSASYDCVFAGNHGTTGGGTAGGTNFNCAITGNQASTGGGTYSSIDYSCLIASNTAVAGPGGGDAGGTLYNCILLGNRATNIDSGGGGGDFSAILINCTVISNSAATSGGGAYGGGQYNCIMYYNNAPTGSNWSDGDPEYCCTIPVPGAYNSACFTNPPVFVNLAGGDLHQQTNSPTINGGYNFYVNDPPVAGTSVPLTNDFDGNPRIVGGTVDVGAYEYQGSNMGLPIPIPWLVEYGLPTDGSDDYLDTDGSGMNNWQEWIAGTIPNTPSTVLRMLSTTAANNPPGEIVTWQSVTNRTYYLQRATNLAAQPAFQPLASNIIGQAGTTSYTDTNAPPPGPYFYRVGVQ